jgi:integrase
MPTTMIVFFGVDFSIRTISRHWSFNRIECSCFLLPFNFSKLRDRKLHRNGLGFYALRHTFETIAGESKDQVAVDFLMGHADQSIAAVYGERISNERLLAVVGVVREWRRRRRFTRMNR